MIEQLELLYTRAWRDHDLEGALAGLPQDFEWLVPGFPGDEAPRGPEATLEFFRDWIEQWDDLRVDWEFEQASPDAVLTFVDMRGRGRASGGSGAKGGSRSGAARPPARGGARRAARPTGTAPDA